MRRQSRYHLLLLTACFLRCSSRPGADVAGDDGSFDGFNYLGRRVSLTNAVRLSLLFTSAFSVVVRPVGYRKSGRPDPKRDVFVRFNALRQTDVRQTVDFRLQIFSSYVTARACDVTVIRRLPGNRRQPELRILCFFPERPVSATVRLKRRRIDFEQLRLGW